MAYLTRAGLNVIVVSTIAACGAEPNAPTVTDVASTHPRSAPTTVGRPASSHRAEPGSSWREVGEATCCQPIERDCHVDQRQTASAIPDAEFALQRRANKIFYSTRETTFDAASFAFAKVQACAPHGNVFAWDKRDVYLLSPQSCGPGSCGDGYTGYWWQPWNVRHPAAFRWLAGGYATDGHFVYNQWHRGPIATHRNASITVFECGPDKSPFAYDGAHWFEDGSPIPAEELEARLGCLPQ